MLSPPLHPALTGAVLMLAAILYCAPVVVADSLQHKPKELVRDISFLLFGRPKPL